MAPRLATGYSDLPRMNRRPEWQSVGEWNRVGGRQICLLLLRRAFALSLIRLCRSSLPFVFIVIVVVVAVVVIQFIMVYPRRVIIHLSIHI